MTLAIQNAGFERIARAGREGQWLQNLKQRISPDQPVSQDYQTDINNLYQLIESYGESMSLTQAEVEELKNQVNFLETYLYDTANQPRPEATPAEPAAQPTGTEWYDAYMQQLSTYPEGERIPSPSQFLSTY